MNSTKVFLLVRPKIPDLVAISARRALTDRLGLDSEISGLVREDLWEIEMEEGVDAAELVGRILDTSTVLANTSKQFVRLGANAIPRALRGPEGTAPVRVEVEEGARAGSEHAALRDVYGFTEVLGLRRSVVWTLHLDAGLSEARKSEVLDRAVVTRSRTTGLLVNPHYQEHRILPQETI